MPTWANSESATYEYTLLLLYTCIKHKVWLNMGQVNFDIISVQSAGAVTAAELTGQWWTCVKACTGATSLKVGH